MASTKKTSSKTPRGKAPRKQVAGKALKFQSSTDLVIDRLAFVELVGCPYNNLVVCLL